jgi:hypothetical protein
MSIGLVSSNLVIVARHFNPSVFSQLWLVRNGIMEEQDFVAGCVFSDQAVNVDSHQFALLVVPPQLQFAPKVLPEQQGSLVQAKIGAIVRALPHTPYTAIGLNFFWHVQPEDGDVAALTRALFYRDNQPMCRLFDTEDARFGAYFSKATFGCRLKLDIKPIMLQGKEERSEVVQFAFNFHLDLPPDGDEAVAAIERHLEIWDQARSESANITHQSAAEVL